MSLRVEGVGPSGVREELFVLERPRLLQSHLEDLQEHLQITQGRLETRVFEFFLFGGGSSSMEC